MGWRTAAGSCREGGLPWLRKRDTAAVADGSLTFFARAQNLNVAGDRDRARMVATMYRGRMRMCT